MKLYKIIFKHCSPKNSKTGICTYIIANDDAQVMRLVDSKYCWGRWQEKEDDFNESSLAGYAEESFLQRVLRFKGECNDPDLEPQDCYYGATYYGWEEIDTSKLSWEERAVYTGGMIFLGICEDWREL
jgi:hypothetical protein